MSGRPVPPLSLWRRSRLLLLQYATGIAAFPVGAWLWLDAVSPTLQAHSPMFYTSLRESES